MDKTTLRQMQEANDYYYAQVFARMFSQQVMQQQLGRLYKQLAELELGIARLEEEAGFKYDPNQPRVPAGNPDGGQWTATGQSADDGEGEIYDPPIESVYPVETLLSGLTGRQALSAIRGAINLWQGARAASRQFEEIADGIEEYLGGPPKRIFRNSKGDLIIIRDGKKIRFNAEAPHGYYYAQVFARMFPQRVIEQQKQDTLRKISLQLAELELGITRLEEEAGFKYDPNQPRVPAGNPDGGQWTATGQSADDGEGEIYDPPIEPVYPVEEAIGFLFGGHAIRVSRSALGSFRVGATSQLTGHGVLRSSQRAITASQVARAIKTAKNAGAVTTKTGKYGTLQNVYRGTNGITVIVETAGRNAGKVITLYRH